MTAVRRSVEQTIARLARRVLIERALVAGTPAARPDAPAAMAALIEYRLVNSGLEPEDLDDWCAQAITAGFGSVAVSARRLAPAASVLAGSKIYLNALCSTDDLGDQLTTGELEQLLSQGAQEIEIALADDLSSNLAGLRRKLKSWLECCHQHKASLIIQLPPEVLGSKECATVCKLMVRVGIDALAFPIHAGIADELGQLRQLLGADIGLHVIGRIESLELARQLLAAGATRLSTPAGLSLLESTRQAAVDAQ